MGTTKIWQWVLELKCMRKALPYISLRLVAWQFHQMVPVSSNMVNSKQSSSSSLCYLLSYIILFFGHFFFSPKIHNPSLTHLHKGVFIMPLIFVGLCFNNFFLLEKAGQNCIEYSGHEAILALYRGKIMSTILFLMLSLLFVLSSPFTEHLVKR